MGDKTVIKVIKKKHASWKKYTTLRRNKDYQEYVIQRNKTTRICRNARIKYERLLIDTFKDNPKKFYGYIRKQQKVKVGVTKLETADGSQTKTDEETANELCDFFQSVFVEESNEVLPVFHDRVVKDDCMWDIHFKIEDVEKRLKNLKQDKAPGPDGIHPKILKECV